MGFVVGKKEQLVSYGHYLQGKLEGFGCKIDANAEYTGEFEAGQLHGLGQVFSNNKFTFGRFEGGTLSKSLVLEERSPASKHKLRELRRKGHIQSIFFENDYLPKDPINFKGIAEIRPNSQ